MIEGGVPIVVSDKDDLLACFSNEYTKLLSHSRAIDGISPEQLRDAFFHKANDAEQYANCHVEIRTLVEKILKNMVDRFGYSEEIATDTIVFALRKNIVSFQDIIT